MTDTARTPRMSDAHRAVMEDYLGEMRQVSADFIEAYRAQTEVLRKLTAEVEAAMADKDWPENLRRRVEELAERAGASAGTGPSDPAGAGAVGVPRAHEGDPAHRAPQSRQGRSADTPFNTRTP